VPGQPASVAKDAAQPGGHSGLPACGARAGGGHHAPGRRAIQRLTGGLGATGPSPRAPVGCGAPAGQGLVGGELSWRRADRRAAVLAGGGGAAADSSEGRQLGVCMSAPGASPSPSAALGRRIRGGGDVAGAVDGGVAAMADGGAWCCFSGRRLRRRRGKAVARHSGAAL
jgi:hypothetical protein